MERNVPNVRQNLHVDRKFELIHGDTIISSQAHLDTTHQIPQECPRVLFRLSSCATDVMLIRSCCE